jgi:hypothetical protein
MTSWMLRRGVKSPSQRRGQSMFKRTSENLPSTTFVNKGKKRKGRGVMLRPLRPRNRTPHVGGVFGAALPTSSCGAGPLWLHRDTVCCGR